MHGSGVSAVTAYTAHREWATRPPDERHTSVHALYEAARARRSRIEERPITFVERELGASKMSGNIVVEAMINVTKWGLAARWAKLTRKSPETAK